MIRPRNTAKSWVCSCHPVQGRLNWSSITCLPWFPPRQAKRWTKMTSGFAYSLDVRMGSVTRRGSCGSNGLHSLHEARARGLSELRPPHFAALFGFNVNIPKEGALGEGEVHKWKVWQGLRQEKKRWKAFHLKKLKTSSQCFANDTAYRCWQISRNVLVELQIYFNAHWRDRENNTWWHAHETDWACKGWGDQVPSC